ncbi:tetratricopeptide repeat protein [Lachnospiraceae bacterium HCP1S3_C3]
MDKYEYNVKSDQIKKLYAKKDYETAAEIADSIDWSRVKNNSMLALVADAYEGTKQYDKARNVLEIAYERSPLGRQLAYRLTILSIRMRDFVAADQYYQEFAEMAPRDVAQYILKYRIARAKGEAIETLISILEAYVDVEMDERWQYELAKLYHEAGEDEKCVEMCDKIILWFSEGKYVTKALELKMRHQTLTEEQQAKYDGKWDYYNERIKAEESAAREKAEENESDGTADDEESASESSDESQEDTTSEAGAENSADGEEGMPEDEESKNEPEPVKDILNDTTALDYLTDYSEDEKVIKEPDTSDIDELTAMEVEMNLSKVVEESIESAKMDAQDISEIFGAEENETEEATDDETAESEETVDNETVEPEETTDNETEESEETSDEEIEEITDDEDEDEEYEDSEDDESDEEMELGDILSGEKEIIDDKLVENEEPDEESEDMTDEEYDQTESDENQADISDESDKQTDVAESDDTEVTDDKADTEDKKNEAPDEESDDKIEIYEFNEKKDGNAKGIGDELMKTAEIDIDEINVKVNSPENLYDTANIQKALAQSMQIIMKAESEKATRNAFAQSEIMDEPTKRIDISGGESGEKAEVQMENEEKYSSDEYAATNIEEEKEEKKTGPVYETVPLPPIYDREEDGQIKIFEPETEEEEQVDGQMSIEDVLLEFEKSKEEALKEAERKEKLAIEAARKAAEEVALAKEAVRKALEEEAAAKTALAKASEVQKVIGDYTASKENPDVTEMLTQDLEAALAQIQETVTMEAMAETAAFMNEDAADTEIPEQEEVQNTVCVEETFETNLQEDELPETDKEEKEEDEPVSTDETEIAEENETAASEEPESSEDNAEDEQKGSLSDEDRKLFIEFLDIPGLEEQISATLDNLVNDFVEDGTSKTNNVIIMGDAKIGKTTLGLGIIKAANRGRKRPGRKVAKVKATTLNKKGVGPAMSQILGTDLIIEQAGNLMPGTVVDLMAAMKSYTEEMIIVLEDDKAALERLVTAHPTLEDMFTNQIYIREFGIDDYVKIAREYAEQKQYVIDEMGTLALYAKIDDINGKNQGISRPEIYEIIDKAISHAEKFKISKLIGKLKRTHYEMGVLKEEDFE